MLPALSLLDFNQAIFAWGRELYFNDPGGPLLYCTNPMALEGKQVGLSLSTFVDDLVKTYPSENNEHRNVVLHIREN